MLRDHFIAFDDYLPAGGTAYSPDRIQQRLAAYDQVAVAVVLKEFVLAAFFDVLVTIEQSGDGETWVGGDPIITGFVTAPQTFIFTGADDGTVPAMHLRRIRISSGSSTRMRVQVYATLRDRGGGKPHVVKGGHRAA